MTLGQGLLLALAQFVAILGMFIGALWLCVHLACRESGK